MFRLLSLIFRNVLRNRRRSLLLLGSTAVSLALLSLVVALYQGFFYGSPATPAETLRVITRHKVSITQSLPASLQQKIDAVPGVEKTSAFSWFGGLYIDHSAQHDFGRFAVDADRIFDIYPDWPLPADQLANFKENRTACAISRGVARKNKLKVGDRITIVGDIYNVTIELTVAGIFAPPQAIDTLFFHREYLRELVGRDNPAADMAGTYMIRTASPDDAPRVSRAIDAMNDNSPYPTRTESEKEFGRSFLAFLGNIKLFLAAICGAVTFTILLVSANTIAMAVRERTREMAILRTLGFAPGEILQLVLAESVVVSVLGGIVGIGLGYLLTSWARDQSGGFVADGLQWQAAAFVLGMAALIGFCAAVVPAVLASRKNVVESLRFTG